MGALKESQSLSDLAMKHELAPTQISKWKKEFLAGAEKVFGEDRKSVKSEAEGERDHLLLCDAPIVFFIGVCSFCTV